MNSFKFFLTIIVLLATGTAAHAIAVIKPEAPAKVPVPKVIGYAWPYAGRDLASELGTGPVVAELFTAQGCVFCPAADQFFIDLLAHAPNVIGLSCHVTYRDVTKGNLSLKACSDRQVGYVSTIQGAGVFTPQMVINGNSSSIASRFDQVYAALKQAAAAPPARITASAGADHAYKLDLPKPATTKPGATELVVLQYQKPIDRVIADGINGGVNNRYIRVISSVHKIESWKPGQDQADIRIQPDENAAGAVVLLQSPQGIIGAADIAF